MDNSNSLSTNLINLDDYTPEQALKLQAHFMGFKRMPVPIEQFIEDDYYLGKTWGKGRLYSYWKEQLMDIFPDPINVRYPFVVATGAIGMGKSAFGNVMEMYTAHKLDCLKNFDYFGIQIEKTIDCVLFHKSAQRAQDILYTPIENQLNGKSPYFARDFGWANGVWNFVCEGLRNDNSTGGDVLFYHFSEVNFQDYASVKFRIDQAFSRLRSRFMKVLGVFGGILIDSSAAEEGSLVEDLIREYPVNLKVIRDPIWVVKKSLGIYFNQVNEKTGRTSFDVYTGDGVIEPYIITPEKPLGESCDPDKVLEVPNELEDEYKSNIYLALQNTAGIGTAMTDTFMQDKEAHKRSYTIPMHIPEIITVDFYDEDEQLIDLVRAQILKECPIEKILCIGIDMGVSGDLCGFSASYFDDWVRDKTGKPTIEFKTKTPVSFGISRKPDQETRISKVFNLIMAINELREVGLVVTDGYQSTQLRQELDAKGIWCYLSSMDRTKDGYLFWKLQVYKGFHECANNPLLFKEGEEVQDVGNKIDHPSENGGSKDLLDAEVNSIYNISLNTAYFSQTSNKYQEIMQKKVLEQLKTPQDEIRDFLKSRRF